MAAETIGCGVIPCGGTAIGKKQAARAGWILVGWRSIGVLSEVAGGALLCCTGLPAQRIAAVCRSGFGVREGVA